jgi:tRNA modification GTPase
MFDDTICAPATAPVNSPIALIRMSGPGSTRAVRSIFSRSEQLRHREAVYGSILDEGALVDDVIVVLYLSPRSYTGEDMAEIFCHGNPLIVRRILGLLNRHGVRPAGPGEFSRKAFLNGKMDLTAAEAINHIIGAKSDSEIDAALLQMHGSLKRKIGTIRDEIILLKADIECGIDFAEEDIEFVSQGDSIARAVSIRSLIQNVLNRCRTGDRISHGIDIPIVGKPNAGKSSILNALLNYERAIVSDIPGTTRDFIRESVQIDGIHVNLIDTAGIDEARNELERMGIEATWRKIEQSSMMLVVLDAVTGIQDADRSILGGLKSKKCIYLINKSDAAGESDVTGIIRELGHRAISCSAVTGTGMELIEREIAMMLKDEFVQQRDFFLADVRIQGFLAESIIIADNIRSLIESGEPPEIIAFELQTLADTLSRITGEITPDDVLNSIFDRFCIGK